MSSLAKTGDVGGTSSLIVRESRRGVFQTHEPGRDCDARQAQKETLDYWPEPNPILVEFICHVWYAAQGAGWCLELRRLARDHSHW